jgi:hypothetical protein
MLQKLVGIMVGDERQTKRKRASLDMIETEKRMGFVSLKRK